MKTSIRFFTTSFKKLGKQTEKKWHVDGHLWSCTQEVETKPLVNTRPGSTIHKEHTGMCGGGSRFTSLYGVTLVWIKSEYRIIVLYKAWSFEACDKRQKRYSVHYLENLYLRFREPQVLKTHELLIALKQSRTLSGTGHMLIVLVSLLLTFFSTFWILNYSALHISSQMPSLVSFSSESSRKWFPKWVIVKVFL